MGRAGGPGTTPICKIYGAWNLNAPGKVFGRLKNVIPRGGGEMHGRPRDQTGIG